MSAFGRGGVLAIVLLAGVAHAPAVLADEPSGTAIAVIQSTQAAGATGSRVLIEQGSVYSGDKITTGPFGQAQIKFRDNTKLVVGPNSSMTIDAFVYGGNTGAKEVSIDAVRGAFRFITGISKKDAYTIGTPTAVIAVRGTEFDFHVDQSDGETEVVMLGGQTSICPKTLADGSPNTDHKDCVQASLSCGMTIVPPSGDPVDQLKASERRNALITANFRYIRDQSGLNDQFKINASSCGRTQSFALPYASRGGTHAEPTAPTPICHGEGCGID